MDERHPISAHPLASLETGDLDLVAELVLQSGSLKAVAQRYGVSYPTIRSRVDRLIERLRRAMTGESADPLTETLARCVERGECTAAAARRILDAARRSAAARSTARAAPNLPSARTPSDGTSAADTLET